MIAKQQRVPEQKQKEMLDAVRNSNGSSILQILNQDGELTVFGDPLIPTEELLTAYKNMVLTRMLDEKIITLQRQGRIGTYVSCSGQEATQVGSVLALSRKDWVFPMYRDMGMIVQMGVPLEDLLNKLFGNEKDASLGRDLPNAYGWKKYRVFSLAAPIASHVQLSVGFAMAARFRRDELVTISSFGDGATSSNEFHVSMNFAGVYRVPTVFICENNQYAISVPISQQTASESIAIKAQAYGFNGIKVDGNDLFAVWVAVKDAVERARNGDGPTLVECLTYRFGAHSTSDDWKRYRANEEVEHWKRRDPLPRLRVYLEKKRSIWSQEKETSLRKELEVMINSAVSKAESLPAPSLDSMFSDVFAEIPSHLKEQSKEAREVT